jgi:hypothetical protein
VFSLVAITLAFAITAPPGSVTVPLICALTSAAWAQLNDTKKMIPTITRRETEVSLITHPLACQVLARLSARKGPNFGIMDLRDFSPFSYLLRKLAYEILDNRGTESINYVTDHQIR